MNDASPITMEVGETWPEIREAVRRLCANYPGDYWRELDRNREYPEAFVKALTDAGYLAVLIPEEYGGSGLPISAGSAVLEEVNASGCNAGACHAQMYIMGTLLRHGSDEQKQRYLPKIATGELRLQAFGVTEPSSGTDTLSLRTTAVRDGNGYVVNGQKIWTSRAQYSDLMLLLARTTPKDRVAKRTDGLSVFLVDMREALGNGLEIRPIRTMINHQTNELFFDNMRIPADALIGEEGRGFRYILDGMNAERILVASDALGDARFFIDRAVAYANDRSVFGRPIGQNQGIQFPIAEAYAQTVAAELMMRKAAALFEAGEPCGPEANMAKHLCAEVSWKAGDVCMQTYGGFAFAEEYDIERKFREARLYRTAPISTNLVLAYLAEHVLGLPRSY
ncbi:MAG: acyl-CoA dehydrogenase [Alphaproteobacteria bacterium]|nr:acyl-CoA dehydrogenase [Alphaproteobacteria bacterium]